LTDSDSLNSQANVESLFSQATVTQLESHVFVSELIAYGSAIDISQIDVYVDGVFEMGVFK